MVVHVPILDKAQAHLEGSPLEQLAPTDRELLEPEPLGSLEALPLEASRAPRVFDSWQVHSAPRGLKAGSW